jgi:hypothetical protein
MDEHFYADGAPCLHAIMTAAQVATRHKEIVRILERAGRAAERRGEEGPSGATFELARKIGRCGPNQRCRSLACPMCARAIRQRSQESSSTLLPSDTELLTMLKKKLATCSLSTISHRKKATYEETEERIRVDGFLSEGQIFIKK